MQLFQKLRKYPLSPTNVLAYALPVLRRWCVTCVSTLFLRCKAALLGVRMGAGVRNCGTVQLQRWPGSSIDIGARCSLISSSWRGTACAVASPVRLVTHGPQAHITLGEGVELSGTSITARSTSISIGAYSMVAPQCIIVDSDFHAPWPAERRHLDPGMDRDKAVTLGRHVWLGMHCIVLKGVTIGDGAVIGAGSVVTSDIPPYCVAAGSPARVISQQEPPARAAEAAPAHHATPAQAPASEAGDDTPPTAL